MRSLNLDQLRSLIEVIERGSFSAAARQLNLTQPAISLQIRALEQRCGVKLVERIGSTTHATAPGRALVEPARRILRDCEAAVSALRRFERGRVGQVRIGTTSMVLSYLLPPIIRRLRGRHPGIELLITSMSTCDTVEDVVQNNLDLGLATLTAQDPRLRLTPLRSDTMVALLPVATPDIPDTITPDYATRQTLVLEHARGGVNELIMQWLGGQPSLRRTPMHIGTVEAAKQAVALGLGMSIVPGVAVAEPIRDVVVRPLNPPAPCTLALVERRTKTDEPALAIVRNALLELRSIAGGEPANDGARVVHGGNATPSLGKMPCSKAPPLLARATQQIRFARPAL